MELMEAKRVLEGAGIDVEEVEALKGSCKVKGLSLGSGSIKPTIYGSSVAEMEDDTDVLEMADRVMSYTPEINMSILLDRDYLTAHTVSCIRHATDDDRHVKWPVYGDLEEYMRVNLGEDSVGGSMSVCVTEGILQGADISADELRIYARRNLRDQVCIKSMAEVLSEMLGGDVEQMITPADDSLMYVASNTNKIHGAAVILLTDVLQEFCIQHDIEELYIIPSSLHEVILVKPVMDKDTVNDMIRDVNETQVDEIDRLSDHVYHFITA